MKTHVVFLLDETGSMRVRKDATIEGFNQYIEELQSSDEAADYRVSVFLFNSDKIEQRYDEALVGEIFPLTDEDYQPRANTPLFDVMAQTMLQTDKVVVDTDTHRNGYGGKTKQRVIFVVLSDGRENHSKEYTRVSDIQALVKERRGRGWAFVFLAWSMDEAREAWRMGIDKSNTYVFGADVQSGLATASVGTQAYARSGGLQDTGLVAEVIEGGNMDNWATIKSKGEVK